MKSELIQLSEYCDSIDYGYTESASTKEIGPKFLRITDIVKKTIDWSSVPYCKISDANFKKFELHDGDIVIARTGNTTGESNYISNPPKAVFASYLIRLKINNSCNPLFVYYFLKSKTYTDHIYSLLGEKSAQKNANAKSLTEVKISFPSKQIQTKIANTLHGLTRKIESLQNQNHILEQTAQAIFKSWFVDFDGVTEFEDSELGKIPKGWKDGKIKDVIDIFDGKRIPLSTMERTKRKGKFPYYGATTIIDFVDDYIFDGKFLLLGEDGSVIHDDGTPFIQFVSGKFWVNNHAHVIQGKKQFSTELIYLFFKNLNINPWITGTTQLKVNQTNLLSIPIIIPSENFLNKFNLLIRPIFSTLLENEKSISILIKTRDTLLPKLMSGEIRV